MEKLRVGNSVVIQEFFDTKRRMGMLLHFSNYEKGSIPRSAVIAFPNPDRRPGMYIAEVPIDSIKSTREQKEM